MEILKRFNISQKYIYNHIINYIKMRTKIRRVEDFIKR